MKVSEVGRVMVRAPLALAWTVGVHAVGVRLPILLGSKKRPMGTIGFWGKGLAKIMGVHVHERNKRSGPMGDVIIANHMGFLDVAILLTYYPAVFVIKDEMRKVFFFGPELEHQGHVFVKRHDAKSRRMAARGLVEVLKDGDRIIVFPEGRASSGSDRPPFKPFSFVAASRLGKRVEACVIDYLPDRKQLEWDVNRSMFVQLIELLGRKRTDVSVEFFPADHVSGDPLETVQRYHQMVEDKLRQYDRERGLAPNEAPVKPSADTDSAAGSAKLQD